MVLLRTASLFALTALAEIGGCYLVFLWARGGRPAWVLMPAAISLALFAGLLTLHPFAAGRTYAAYAGMYLTVALAWLWAVEGIRPDRWDVLGALVSLVGMGILVLAPRS